MFDSEGHRFPVEMILVCVRCYCKYGINYGFRLDQRLRGDADYPRGARPLA